MLEWEEHGMQSGRFITRTLVGLALASAAVAGLPDPLRAQARREPSRAELEERIRRLEQIIQERGLDKPAPKPSAAAAEAGPPVDKAEVEAIVDSSLKKQKMLAGWKDGFFLESPSGDFKMKIRGYIQADARAFPNKGGDTGFNNLYLRRVRPIVEGTVYKWFDYKIMPDFGGGTSTLQDAWAGINYFPEARFRGGKFKPPVSLERLQSGADLTFVERSLLQNIVPNRDVGFQLAGDFWDGIFSYQIGVFDGTIDGGSNDNDVSSEKEFAGRIFSEPAKKSGIPALAGLGVGVAGTYGDLNRADNLSAIQYRTPARSTFFKFDTSSSVSIAGDDERHRIVPQAYWYWGPFGLMGEYAFSKEGVRQTNSTTGDVVRADLDNSAWFTQASWVITGEDASYKGVSPINNFDPRNGRWGAFELAVRYGELRVDEDAFDLGLASKPTSTDGAQNYTVGVNWYLNRSFKFNFNYEHTDFDNKVTFGDSLRDKEDVILTRFQISY
jgi:phosphate-selective porin OprO/OprP